jgi:hypothetical protein
MNTVDFVQMKDGTAQEYHFLHGLETDYIRALPDRLLLALERLVTPCRATRSAAWRIRCRAPRWPRPMAPTSRPSSPR